MSRKRSPKRSTDIMDGSDPHGMVVLMRQYFEHLRIKNYSELTIAASKYYLIYFIEWAAVRGIGKPSEVTRPVIERYQRHVYYYRQPNGKPLSFKSQNNRLAAVRVWFKWMARKNHILYNPAGELELPRPEYRLPKYILTASEAEQVINQPNVSESAGVRDRAMLETLYSTGVRRSELIALRPHDIDMERGTIVVRQGKGNKDRMIPIGDRALAWIGRYLAEVRPGLAGDADALFLNQLGNPFSPNRLSIMVSQYVSAADIGKQGSCHLFRHSMATLMLENGADIRFIQQMLGHAQLETTQVYTRVSIRKLKDVHTATHPAKLSRGSGEARQE